VVAAGVKYLAGALLEPLLLDLDVVDVAELLEEFSDQDFIGRVDVLAGTA